MSDEEKLPNIYQRINKIRKAVDYVKKDKKVAEGGGYMAVTHDAVTAIVRPHMTEHGVVCVPQLIESSVTDTGTTTSKGTPFIRYSAKYQFEFVNADEPGDSFKVVIESHALDVGDKAPGKALSYAKKYAILKLLELETGDDDEGRQEQKVKREKNTPRAEDAARVNEFPDLVIWLRDVSSEIKALIKEGDVKAAFDNYEVAKGQLNDFSEGEKFIDRSTQLVALWDLFDSKERSALKKEGQRKAELEA